MYLKITFEVQTCLVYWEKAWTLNREAATPRLKSLHTTNQV